MVALAGAEYIDRIGPKDNFYPTLQLIAIYARLQTTCVALGGSSSRYGKPALKIEPGMLDISRS